MRQVNKPETQGQAETHGVITKLYQGDGLCIRCAAQLAYGHQLGFNTLETQPCGSCVDVVAQLPQRQPNGWRSVIGDARRESAHASKARQEAA